MNDFEEQLRQVKPAPLSNELMVRLQMARPVSQPRPVSGWWRLAVPLAAAAAAVVLVANLHRSPAPGPSPAIIPVSKYEPVGAEDFILSAKPAGIGHTEDGVPYRFLRCVGVRREVWKKRADGSEVAVVVPQEQIIIAKMDVY
jgi:hypothetical protein